MCPGLSSPAMYPLSSAAKRPRHEAVDNQSASPFLHTASARSHPRGLIFDRPQPSASSVSAPPTFSRPLHEDQPSQLQGLALLPRRSLPPLSAQGNTLALSSWLKNILTNDLSAHAELLAMQGFTVPRLGVLATWSRSDIGDALGRLLIPSSGGRKGMKAFEVVSLELAIRKLKAKTPGSAPPVSSGILPPNSSAVTLSAFLKNVMGLDLSRHHELLTAQGFDLARLRSTTTWEREDAQEVLSRTLKADSAAGGKTGMSALEVVALEFAIRKV
ncbi:hypothetical protein B0H17DRAFT_541086 [Mycena rosella]|uniref:Uncharacterized protein n=1 Tax=Mycena rosella TaxID=1033263 RepID=A0AAD7GJU8_MYCRO|nr:hypothetical protein B0H17DRAFT_541086 [Mycena rosella]